MSISFLDFLDKGWLLSEFGVIIIQQLEDLVQCLEENPFYFPSNQLVPLYQTTKIININVPVLEWTTERFSAVGQECC